MDLIEGQVEANGITFATLEAGSGPLALCLHGFPDSPWTYSHLLPALAEAGYRAVAPALRGYAPTGPAPDGVYRMGAYVADALALHEALGGDADAVLVGHDWGAIAAYPAVNHAPERWRRLVTLAVPPADAVMQGFFQYEQLKRSFYIFLFQHPLAEMAVQMDDLAFIDGLWADWSPGFNGGEFLRRAKESVTPPGALASVLDAYRSMLGTLPPVDAYAAFEQSASGPLARPTLYLHGADDGCLGADTLASVEAALPEGSRFEQLSGVGHFLHLEAPEQVNQLIVDFLTAS